MDSPKVDTHRELWREKEGDYYASSLFVTQDGGIGINVNGRVYVKPIQEWFACADTPPPPKESNGFPRIPGLDKPEEGLEEEIRKFISMLDECFSSVRMTQTKMDGKFIKKWDGLSDQRKVLEKALNLHASIVKPLREKAESLQKELDKQILANVILGRQANEKMKDRDAWKEKHRTEENFSNHLQKSTIPRIEEDAARLAEALRFLISDGKVDEGEGIWLGHSGQLKAEEALTIHEKLVGGSRKEG